MNWIDIAWPLMSGVSLTLALIYLLIWLRQRSQPAMLVFAVAAVLVSVVGIVELLLMNARTPAEYAAVLRWGHGSISLALAALIVYVLLHFRAGIAWIGISGAALRLAITLPAALRGGSVRFDPLLQLERVDLLGAMVTAPVGKPNPWMFAIEFCDLLLVVFFFSAIVQVWRRSGDPDARRRIALVCGTMILFVVSASSWATLIATGTLHAPFIVVLPFVGVMVVMAYDLGTSEVRAAQLATQLRDSETTLRGTEERLQLTADAVGMGLWTWDLRTDEQWFTETGGALLGLGDDGRIDHDSFLVRVHPDDRAAMLRARDDALRGSGSFECEYRLVQPGGAMRWIAATGRVEQAVGDIAPVMRGVVIDITERRQAEERFRLVVESSPTAMLMVDAGGRITLANAQATHLFGYARADLLGQEMDMLVPQHARLRHARHRSHFLRNPQARSMGGGREILARRSDGSEVRVEIALTPVRVGDDMLVLTSITDISERLRIEQEVAIQRDELAHLSRISLLGEMSASLAHELNQPLTAVLSNAQAALRFLDRDVPDLVEVRESLLHIVENDKRAGEVIRRLRAMLRKEQTDYQPLLVNEVVHDVLRLVSSDLVNRNVSTVIDLAPALPFVLGDRVQLQQVLLNLIVNACDAMSVQKARVVTIRTQLTPDAHVEIAIRDIGPGIPEADLERIFTPFVTTKTQGMGLGLAVCRTIIQAHSGTLRATNDPSEGATMLVTLPPLEPGAETQR
jgi:PAS domain S-box-containing protein